MTASRRPPGDTFSWCVPLTPSLGVTAALTFADKIEDACSLAIKGNIGSTKFAGSSASLWWLQYLSTMLPDTSYLCTGVTLPAVYVLFPVVWSGGGGRLSGQSGEQQHQCMLLLPLSEVIIPRWPCPMRRLLECKTLYLNILEWTFIKCLLPSKSTILMSKTYVANFWVSFLPRVFPQLSVIWDLV